MWPVGDVPLKRLNTLLSAHEWLTNKAPKSLRAPFVIPRPFMQVKNLPLPVLSHRLKTSCCVAKAEPSSSLNMTITFFTLYDTTIHRVIEIYNSFTPGLFSQLSDTYPIFLSLWLLPKGKWQLTYVSWSYQTTLRTWMFVTRETSCWAAYRPAAAQTLLRYPGTPRRGQADPQTLREPPQTWPRVPPANNWQFY